MSRPLLSPARRTARPSHRSRRHVLRWDLERLEDRTLLSTAGGADPIPLNPQADGSATQTGDLPSGAAVDVYQYVAPVTGWVNVAASPEPGSDLTPAVEVDAAAPNFVASGTGGVSSPQSTAFLAVAGQTYDIQVSSEDGVGAGDYTLSLAPAPTTALQVPSTQSDQFQQAPASHTFSFTAPATGQVTVAATPAAGSGLKSANLDVEVDDASHGWLAENTGPTSIFVLAGQTYFVRVSDAASDESGNYTLALSSSPLATLPPDSTLTGQIQDPGDVVAYSFTAPATGQVTVAATPASGSGLATSGLDVAVEDPSRSQLASGTGSASVFVTAGQTYFVQVQGDDPTAFGGYSLATTTQPDDYGNTFAQAQTIAVLTPVDGQINYPGDVDMFRFTAPATGLMSVTHPPSDASGPATVVTVFDRNGKAIASDDPQVTSSTVGVGNLSGFLVFTGQTYDVQISSRDGASTGGYALSLGPVEPPAALPVPAVQAGQVAASGDVGVFSFTAPGDGRMTILHPPADGSGLATHVTVFDKNGNAIASDDPGNTKSDYFWGIDPSGFPVTADRTYIVKVSSADGTSTGGYSLSLGFEAARALASSGIQAGQITAPGQVDAYTFTAPATTTGTMAVSVVPAPGSTLDGVVTVFDNSTDIGIASDDPNNLNNIWLPYASSFSVDAGKTYSVWVSSSSGTGTGGYTLVASQDISDSLYPPDQGGPAEFTVGAGLYSFDAPVTGSVTLTPAAAPGGGPVPQLTASDAKLNPVGTATSPGGSPDGGVTLAVTAGYTYSLEVAAPPGADPAQQYSVSASVKQSASGTNHTPATADDTTPGIPVDGNIAKGQSDYYQVGWDSGELVAQVHAVGATVRLALVNAQGQVLVQSDGQSAADGDPLIDQILPGDGVPVYLVVQGLAGAGGYTLTTTTQATQVASPPGRGQVAVGKQPAAIATGDFNRDGHLDLVVANQGSGTGTVSVLPGHGDGTFANQVQYAVGSQPDAIAVADFNGDGSPDLAVADAGSGDVRLLFNLGDGVFEQQSEVVLPVGGRPSAVVAGDFNGDGIPDLAVATGSSVQVFLNRGHGVFQPDPPMTLRLPPGFGAPTELAAGDFTGDGFTDLAVAGASSSTVVIYRGDRNHPLQAGPPMIVQVGAPALSLTTGDFTGHDTTDPANHQPVVDLAVGDQHDEVTVVSLDSRGKIVEHAASPTSLEPDALAAGDFSGGPNTDLIAIASHSSTDSVSLLSGRGDGTFRAPVSLTNLANASSPTAIAAGDFDGDGRADVAIADGGTNELSVLLSSPPQIAVGSKPSAVVTGDFNDYGGDGYTDLAVANAGSDSVSVLINNGHTPDGTFQNQVAYAVGKDPVALAAGDFGNGYTDLAVADAGSKDITILENNGDGTFTALPPIGLQFAPTALVVGDFNGDGFDDLAVVGQGTDAVEVLLSDRDGTFTPQAAIKLTFAPTALAAGDFTNRGVTDLAVAGSSSSTVAILLGDPSNPLHAVDTVTVGGPVLSLATGDFTGRDTTDPFNALPVVDLAVGDKDGEVTVLSVDSRGKVVQHTPSPTSVEPDALAAEDFDGGNTDLAVLGRGQGTAAVQVLFGHGDGTFAAGTPIAVGGRPVALAAGDFNNDGATDLVYTGPDQATLTELLNAGGGAFPGFGPPPPSPPSSLNTAVANTPIVIDNLTGPGLASTFIIDTNGEILWRKESSPSSGSFGAPTIINPSGPPARDIAAVQTPTGWMIAGLDATDDQVTLYTYDSATQQFQRTGSLATGTLPAQVLAADLTGSGRCEDLVVRDAGDDSLTVFLGVGKGGPPTTQTIPVGPGISDVSVGDVNGDGKQDLIVTDQDAGTVGVLINQGSGSFADPVIYRAGGGTHTVDTTTGTAVETSSDQTAGAVALPTPGGPTDLVTLNPGTSSLSLLAGLGGGPSANPRGGTFANSADIIATARPGSIVREAVLGDNGDTPDLIVLDSQNVTVYRGDPQDGYAQVYSTNNNAGLDPTGLTIADVNGDGLPDLLIGNRLGDVLVLENHTSNQGMPVLNFGPVATKTGKISLAVTNDTNGQNLIVIADQDHNQITVQNGVNGPISTLPGPLNGSFLAPPKVVLAALNGPGTPPDLIVVNSVGGNALVYPGLGGGHFGPELNGGAGFFTGIDPVDVEAVDVNGDGRPDLVVTNQGSNDVSVLLNEPQGNSFTLVPAPRLSAGPGPVSATVAQQSTGPPSIVVSSPQSNQVRVIRGLGAGYFDGQGSTIIPVTNPLQVYPSPGGGVYVLSQGSSELTSITGLNGSGPVVQRIALPLTPTTASVDPKTGDVAVAGPGQAALLQPDSNGLKPVGELQTDVLPKPTDLAFVYSPTNGTPELLAVNAGNEQAYPLVFLTQPTGQVPDSPIVVTGQGNSLVAQYQVNGNGLTPAQPVSVSVGPASLPNLSVNIQIAQEVGSYLMSEPNWNAGFSFHFQLEDGQEFFASFQPTRGPTDIVGSPQPTPLPDEPTGPEGDVPTLAETIGLFGTLELASPALGEGALLAQAVQQVVQLLPEGASGLALIATLLTISPEISSEVSATEAGAEAPAVAAVAGALPNQPLSRANPIQRGNEEVASVATGGDEEGPPPVVTRASAWLRLMLGIDEAFEQSAEEFQAKPPDPPARGPSGRLDEALDALLGHWPSEDRGPAVPRRASPELGRATGPAVSVGLAGQPGPGTAVPALHEVPRGDRTARGAGLSAVPSPAPEVNASPTATGLALALAAAGGIVPLWRHQLHRRQSIRRPGEPEGRP